MTSKSRKAAAFAVLFCSIISGCSGMDENGTDAPVRVSSEVQDEVEKVSSSILEILSLKAKMTESGAMISPCKEGAYRAHHPWGVFGPPAEDLGEAMDRLRSQLPKKGWKIVKDGPDGSQARSPQIVADSADGKFSVDARFHGKRSDDPAQLEVTVQSACFRPEPGSTS
ncbi:hypothetical protein PV689_13735 [Streptomyces sp. ATCC51928]|uniref:Lipoprotein n=1 Tax=Streptomyces caviscabies TaxID=90079 RepID=A0ABW2M2T9_9ACTN|nr:MULTISPECIES: hypothetical protein [unclassified Streptomyces]MDX3502979.1 hypothetical protein [Streptomyces sp. ATCC51928]MDX5523255.1 hypothetical protein [Streptomyces sp. DE06-01C]